MVQAQCQGKDMGDYMFSAAELPEKEVENFAWDKIVAWIWEHKAPKIENRYAWIGRLILTTLCNDWAFEAPEASASSFGSSFLRIDT